MITAGREAYVNLRGATYEKAIPDSLGVASFGPVCLDRTSSEYGNITTTPTLAW